MTKHTQGELAEMVTAAYRQIHTEFTHADVANKVLEAHPEVNRADLDAAVNAVLDFHDIDLKLKQLCREADVLHDQLHELTVRAIAAGRQGEETGDYKEAWKLKAEFEAKYARSARLHAEITRMFEEKKKERRYVNELFKANPDCKTLGDLQRKLAS